MSIPYNDRCMHVTTQRDPQSKTYPTFLPFFLGSFAGDGKGENESGFLPQLDGLFQFCDFFDQIWIHHFHVKQSLAAQGSNHRLSKVRNRLSKKSRGKTFRGILSLLERRGGNQQFSPPVGKLNRKGMKKLFMFGSFNM